MTLQFEGVGFGTGTGSGGKIGTVVLVAMGSQPSTPYTVGSKWFYNGKIYTATTTTAHDSGVTPSYDTAYLFNGTYYYWDGSTLQGADESNLVHISGAETITGNKTFSGSVALGNNASAQTKPTSDTSNAVATTQFVKDFEEDGEWQKPADWIDIRSGALDNSFYFLVAHSKPTESGGVYSVADYPKFGIEAEISDTTHTYDVIVDGIKIATTSSGSATLLDWGALYTAGTITSGYDIANPGNSGYTSHIVRVTPSVSTDKLTRAKVANVSGQQNQGLLWVHVETSEVINLQLFIGGSNIRNPICEAVTAKNDKIKYLASEGTTGLFAAFGYAASLKKLPILEADNTEIGGGATLDLMNVPAKKIVIKNNSEKLTFGLLSNFKGEILDIENPLRFQSGTSTGQTAENINNLKKLPKISTTEKGTILFLSRADNLEPTFIDESFNDSRTCFRFHGASGHQTNLVGLIVSSSAHFSYATAPQIDISYTNMSRAALVKLFDSMPTVSDSQEIDITGTIGAGDLTAEDIAIATGKGWTVTR